MSIPRDRRENETRRALRRALDDVARELPVEVQGNLRRLSVRVPAGADARDLRAALRRALVGAIGAQGGGAPGHPVATVGDGVGSGATPSLGGASSGKGNTP
ncbi:hypothetical protein SAMN04488245_102432 [Alloyangia pacifica]|uniref:Uncharacterized protein n=1 Tax=Alloyangia pacifica TaxID=311180 RepID=A0A1I6PSA1_9RHOB|nr:hypothetical protein SAMN04488245_102432 [Alloyangia pacifica]SFS43069.1 hypothetical protein SAMN04488050_101733 [Alloyangia pacifica]